MYISRQKEGGFPLYNAALSSNSLYILISIILSGEQVLGNSGVGEDSI